MPDILIRANQRISYQNLGDDSANDTAIFLHGIMGSKKNLHGFVKSYVEARPQTRALIIDLRNHGQSSKHMKPLTVASCAQDVVDLCSKLAVSPTIMVGHSFGAKVALLAANDIESVHELWMLDCSPSAVLGFKPREKARPKTTIEVIDILERVSWPIPSKRQVIDTLISQGLSPGVAAWMTTNLMPCEGGFRLVFELSEIRALLDDFLALDGWSDIASLSRRAAIHLVAAREGQRVFDDDRQKLIEVATLGHGFFHWLENAGHFLHVDNPAGLIEIMTAGEHLPQ